MKIHFEKDLPILLFMLLSASALVPFGLTIGKLGAGESVLARFANYLQIYVLPKGLLAITQALWAPAPIRCADFQTSSLRYYPYYRYAYAAMRTYAGKKACPVFPFKPAEHSLVCDPGNKLIHWLGLDFFAHV